MGKSSGKGKGKPGKGANAPFDDPDVESRYQQLIRKRFAEGKAPISRARFARQLNHAGLSRVPSQVLQSGP